MLFIRWRQNVKLNAYSKKDIISTIAHLSNNERNKRRELSDNKRRQKKTKHHASIPKQWPEKQM